MSGKFNVFLGPFRAFDESVDPNLGLFGLNACRQLKVSTVLVDWAGCAPNLLE